MICAIRIGQLPEEIAFLLLYIRIFTAAYFFMQILIAVITKYVIIFHEHYFELVDDKTVVNVSRVFCCFWALLVTLWPFQIDDVSKTADFLSLTTGTDVKLTYTNSKNPNSVIYLLILVDIFAIIFVHIQIEIYKAKGMSASMNVSGYTLGFRRKVVVLILFFGLLILSRLIFPFANYNGILIQYVINQFFLMNVIPILPPLKSVWTER